MKSKEYFNLLNEKCKVINGDFIDYQNKDNKDGTGLVHLSPYFGEEDYEVCINNKVIDKESVINDIIVYNIFNSIGNNWGSAIVNIS